MLSTGAAEECSEEACYDIIQTLRLIVPHPTCRRMSVMSLRPHVVAPVPEETTRVARAAFPKGNPDTVGEPLALSFQ